MSEQTEKTNNNLLVKLVKRSIGLPTGGSNCCGVAVQEAEPESYCGEEPAVQTKATGCGCGAVESTGSQA